MDLQLSSKEIDTHLSVDSRALINKLEIFPIIDSTNTYLMTLAQNQFVSKGHVCLAQTQTAGKGRRGREWISPEGKNIYCSFLWQFQNAQVLNGLSLAVGVGVIRALNEYGIFDINLKWPNDIYSQSKKLGGILIEMTTDKNGTINAVIGLGLNLFLPKSLSEITQPYTDLEEIAPHIDINRNELIAKLLSHLLPIADTFEQKGFSAYLNEWRNYDFLFGKYVDLFVGSQKINGFVQGIDDNGLLKLQHEDGTMQVFASGEVSFSA